MAVAAATQWAFNVSRVERDPFARPGRVTDSLFSSPLLQYTMTKITPYLIIGLPKGRIFFLFACMNLLSAAFGCEYFYSYLRRSGRFPLSGD